MLIFIFILFFLSFHLTDKDEITSVAGPGDELRVISVDHQQLQTLARTITDALRADKTSGNCGNCGGGGGDGGGVCGVCVDVNSIYLPYSRANVGA